MNKACRTGAKTMLKVIIFFTLHLLMSVTNLHAAMNYLEMQKLQKAQTEVPKTTTHDQSVAKKPGLIRTMDSINTTIDNRTERIAAPKKILDKKDEIKTLEEAAKKAEVMRKNAKTETGIKETQARLEQIQQRIAQAKEDLEALSKIDPKKGTVIERYNIDQQRKQEKEQQRAADISAKKTELKDIEKEITANQKMLKEAKTDAEKQEAKDRLKELQEQYTQTKKDRDDLLKKQSFTEKITAASTSHDKLLYGGTIAAVSGGAVATIATIGAGLALKSEAMDQLSAQQAGGSPSAATTDEEGRVIVTIE
jgi:DNA repair exonuclease SbcCD ATPase subunit